MTCANPKCPLDHFSPMRRNQIYCSRRCKSCDKNRRWPLRRQKQILRSAQNDKLPGSEHATDSPISIHTPQTSGVTPLLVTQAAPKLPKRVKTNPSAKSYSLAAGWLAKRLKARKLAFDKAYAELGIED